MNKSFWLILGCTLIFAACKNEAKQGESETVIEEKISLAEWSFNRTIFDGKMSNLDFIRKAGTMGFTGVEYVNAFFKDKATNTAYLDSMIQTAKESNVKNLLIMIDGEGYLADVDIKKRDSAVDNHKKWVDAAAYLGCHSIRVNAFGEGEAALISANAVDGLTKLCTYAKAKNINVIVENHGGHSSNGAWLADVMAKVNMPNCGTLPDFGNFCVKRADGSMWNGPCGEEYDRYKGVAEMMPYAKALSAKSHEFDPTTGEETKTDYKKMAEIAKAAKYDGYIGVEYEGKDTDEEKGVLATKQLILKHFYGI